MQCLLPGPILHPSFCRVKNVLIMLIFVRRLSKAQKFVQHKEAVAQRCSVKKMFLEISQNSQENTCAKASF